MSLNQEPRTSEEYIEKVLRESQKMQHEQVPSHRELIKEYSTQRQYYENQLKLAAGILVLIIVAFLAVRATVSPDSL